MQKWEYMRLYIKHVSGVSEVFGNGVEIFDRYGKSKGQKFDMDSYLMQLGADGWELVSTSQYDLVERMYFKRPIE